MGWFKRKDKEVAKKFNGAGSEGLTNDSVIAEAQKLYDALDAENDGSVKASTHALIVGMDQFNRHNGRSEKLVAAREELAKKADNFKISKTAVSIVGKFLSGAASVASFGLFGKIGEVVASSGVEALGTAEEISRDKIERSLISEDVGKMHDAMAFEYKKLITEYITRSGDFDQFKEESDFDVNNEGANALLQEKVNVLQGKEVAFKQGADLDSVMEKKPEAAPKVEKSEPEVQYIILTAA